MWFLAGSWVQVYDDEGAVSYLNTHTQEEKDELSAEEQQQLLPNINPYDNELVMPLKVRSFIPPPSHHPAFTTQHNSTSVFMPPPLTH